MDTTVTAIMHRTSGYVLKQFMGIDTYSINKDTRELVENIRRVVAELKLDVRDYEYAETRVEQKRYRSDAKKRLEEFRALILAASSADLFGPVDVAHLSALLEQINEKLD